jgi:hypothetical protein
MKSIILALMFTGVLASTSFAQINQRFENQQDRIAAGIRDGQLNAREASNLERREYGINREVRFDRAHDCGRLTGAERFRINQQQNRLSRTIYIERHYR